MNDTHRRRRTWDDWLAQAEAGLVGALLLASLAIVLCQVLARALFDHPLAWTDEGARLCLVWLTFVGAGYLMAHGRHLAVDALVRRLPRRARLAGEVISNLVVIAVCGTVLVAGFGFVTTVARSTSPALSVSMAWFYGAAIVGLVMVVVHAVTNTVRALHRGHALYTEAADDVVDDVVALESGSDVVTTPSDSPHAGSASRFRHEDRGVGETS